MAAGENVGYVAALWRFPVKSMKGERLDHAEVTAQGILGDRAYGLIDAINGKVAAGKNPKLFRGLLDCQAVFMEQPRTGHDLPPVQITLPDGTSVASDSSNIDRVLSAYFGRELRLAQKAPDDFTIDQYHPDMTGLHPAGYRDTTVEQKLGSALFADMGTTSPIPVGSFLDLFPVTVLTTSTLEQLSEFQPLSRFDQRRFRMNVVVNTQADGFIENDWIGRTLTIGDTVRLNIVMPDPRCVMTTLAQDELPKDTDILKALTRHNRVQVGAAGLFPCAGVYAMVEVPGVIRTGDRVALT